MTVTLTLVNVCWLTLSCLSWNLCCSNGFDFTFFDFTFPFTLLLLSICSKDARFALISRSSIIRGSDRFNSKRSLKSLPRNAKSDFSFSPSMFLQDFSDSTTILSTDDDLSLSSNPSLVSVWTLSKLLASSSL